MYANALQHGVRRQSSSAAGWQGKDLLTNKASS